MTRSLGDCAVKEVVTGAPYTTETEITESDAFLIVACDGVSSDLLVRVEKMMLTGE